jgi:hypothetical protein
MRWTWPRLRPGSRIASERRSCFSALDEAYLTDKRAQRRRCKHRPRAPAAMHTVPQAEGFAGGLAEGRGPAEPRSQTGDRRPATATSSGQRPADVQHPTPGDRVEVLDLGAQSHVTKGLKWNAGASSGFASAWCARANFSTRTTSQTTNYLQHPMSSWSQREWLAEHRPLTL